MELRVLKYYLAVVREGSILGAANALHIAQPSLSRQMHDLENEIGKPLFIRSNRRITLTEEGILLRNRAAEILELVQKTESELAEDHKNIIGDVCIAAANYDSFRFVAELQKSIQEDHPQICFKYTTGDGEYVRNQLDLGLADFGIVIEPFDLTDFEYVQLPETEVLGIMMRDDWELAQYEFLTPDQLIGIPLLIPKQFKDMGFLRRMLHVSNEELIDIRGIIDNPYNGALMVQSGIGYALCIDFDLITLSKANHLVFRPLSPEVKSCSFVIWKKYQYFSHASEVFLSSLKTTANE